jgi:non-ribosomal peptide synthase protein (TIGR01720 family)
MELLPVQRCFFYRNFKDKNYWNETINLFMKDRIDETIIRRVIYKEMQNHDSLRLVFKNEDGHYKAYIKNINEVKENLTVYNIASAEESLDLMTEAAYNLHRSMDLAEGPLIRFALFKTDKGDYFYGAMHHLAIDGFSMQVIANDILKGYVQAISGQEITFPEKTASVLKWSEFINDYALGDEITKEIEYWDKVDSTPVKKLPKDSETAERTLKTDAHERVYLLNEEETDKYIKDSCKLFKVNAETILLTALGMVLDRWGDMEKAHVRLCGNGRLLPFSTVDLENTVGWLSLSYPFLLDTGKNIPVAAKVENVREALSEVPNMGAGYDILRFITNPVKYPEKNYCVEPEIFFNYIGVYGEPENEGDNILAALKAVPEKNPESCREYTINIEGAIWEGKLKIHLEYNSNEFKRESMLVFLDEYKKALIDIGESK